MYFNTYLLDLSIVYIQFFYFILPNFISNLFTQNSTLLFLIYFPTFLYSYLNSITRINKFIFINNLSLNLSLNLSNNQTKNKVPEIYEILYFWIYLQFSYLFISICSLFLIYPLVFILNVLSTSFLISNYINSLYWGGFINNGLFISTLEKYPLYSLLGAIIIETISSLVPPLFYYLFYILILLQWIRFSSYIQFYLSKINHSSFFSSIFKFLDLIINPLIDLIGKIIIFILSHKKNIKNS